MITPHAITRSLQRRQKEIHNAKHRERKMFEKAQRKRIKYYL